MNRHAKRLLPVFFFTLASLVSATPTPTWKIYSQAPDNTIPSTAYWNFPFTMSTSTPGGSIQIRSAMGFLAPEYCDTVADYDGSGVNVATTITPGGLHLGYVQTAMVGKVLYNAFATYFVDPVTHVAHHGAMYYDTQRHYNCLLQPCISTNGKNVSFTDDGYTFGVGTKIMQDCDIVNSQCVGTNWWCDNGFPCDTANPRSWWTTGDFQPIRVNGAFYGVGFTFESFRPGQPAHSSFQVWSYTSSDGVTWSKYLQLNPVGIIPNYQAGCVNEPALINPDIAHDIASDTYYITRAYSDNYGGCNNSLPDRVQLYSAAGSSSLASGAWTLLLDLGCLDLGFQPDSVSILHDGLGNVLWDASSHLQLVVAVSGAGYTHTTCFGPDSTPSNCGPPPLSTVYQLAVGPSLSVSAVAPTLVSQKLTSYMTSLTISGQGFQAGATVTIASVPCSITSLSATQIQCTATVPAPSPGAPFGFRTVAVSLGTQMASLVPGLELRRFGDVSSVDAYASGIWKATTLHPTMYDVVVSGTDGVTTSPSTGFQSFNPATNVERRDMARYIARARGEAAVTGCGTPFFTDVPCSDPDWGWIERIRLDRITAGCGGSLYCPNADIPRNQMAVFIETGLGHVGATGCDPAHLAFNDVPCTDNYWPWIQRFTIVDHISVGCSTSPSLYCPTLSVSRQQMAAFVSTAWSY